MSGEVLFVWKLANVASVFKKSKEKGLGNYRPVHFTLVISKIMEKVMLGVTEEHLRDNTVLSHGQHRFTSLKSCLTNLIPLYGKVTHLVGQVEMWGLVVLARLLILSLIISFWIICMAHSWINT